MASERKRHSAEDDALTHAAVAVLRPMLRTATVAATVCMPMALSTSALSELQSPLATAVIGGMVSSTASRRVILPALLGPLVASELKLSGDSC